MSGLETLNLDDEALKAYLILLSFGSATANELSAWSDLTEEKVHTAILTLHERGFVSKFGGVVEKWTPYYPLGDFIENLTSFQNSIDKSIQDALTTLRKEQEKLGTSKNNSINAINTTFTEQTDVIRTFEANKKNFINERVSEALMAISGHLEAFEGELKSTLDEPIESFRSNLQGVLSTVKDQTTSALGRNNELFSSSQSSITRIIDNYKTVSIESLNSFQESIFQLVDSLEGNLVDQSKSFQQETFSTLSNLKEGVGNTIDGFEHNVSKTSDLSLSTLTTLYEALSTSLVELTDQLVNTAETTLNSLQKSFSIHNQDMNTAVQTITTNTKEKTNQTFHSIQEAVGQTHQRLSTGWETLKTGIQSSLEESVSSGRAAIEVTIEEIDEQTNSLLNSSLDSLRGRGEELKSHLTQTVSIHDTSAKEQLAGVFSHVEQDISEQLGSNENNLKEKVTTAQASMKSTLGEIKDNFSNSINEFQSGFTAKRSTLDMGLNSLRENLETALDQHLNEAQTSLNQMFANLRQEWIQTIESHVQTNLEEMHTVQNEIDVLSGDHFTDISNRIEDGILSLQEVVDQGVQTLSETSAAQRTSLDETVQDAAARTIKESTDLSASLLTNLEQSIEQQSSVLSTEAEQWTQQVHERVRETQNGIMSTLTTIETDQGGIISTQSQTAMETITQLLQLNDQLTTLENELLSAQSSFQLKVSETLTTQHNSVIETIEGSKIGDSLIDFKNDMENKLHSSINLVQENVTGLQGAIGNFVQGLKSKFDFSTNEAQDFFNQRQTTFDQSLTATLSGHKNTLQGIVQSSGEQVENTASEAHTSIQESLKTVQDEQGLNFDGFGVKSEEILQNFGGVADEAFKNIQSKTQAATSGVEKTTTSGIIAVQTQTEQVFTQISSTAQAAMDAMQNTAKEQATEVVDKVSSHLSEEIPAIFSTGAIGELGNAATQLSSLLKELRQQVLEHQRPDENVMFLHSTDAILRTINEWLQTAKAGVNIVVPSYVDLDLEVLKSVPMRRRVTIYTDVGNRAWMEPFQDRSNIRFFHVETGPQLPPVYAVDRESEEILFGPAKMKNPMAILSSEDNWINAIAKNLMSQYMAMARRVSL